VSERRSTPATKLSGRGSRVVDASVAIKWVVSETGSGEALALLGYQLLAPSLFLMECANILWKKVRRGEMSAGESNIAVKLLASFGVELCSCEPELTRVLELAIGLDHPACDCAYLALAEARGIPLVTADERLIRVVRAAARSGRLVDRISVAPLITSQAVN